MLAKIQEMEFIAIELNLYLDTHPCDDEALCDYNRAVEDSRCLVRKYEAEFGPLYNFGLSANCEDVWQWIKSPWPWEI